MSKSPKGATAAKDSAAEMPFEEALQKLESIVESMEGDDLPLETLLARFEEGNRLAQVCQSKLAEAELKIQQLGRNAAGQIETTPVAFDDTNA